MQRLDESVIEGLSAKAAGMFEFWPRVARPIDRPVKRERRKELRSKDALDWLVSLNENPWLATTVRDRLLNLGGARGRRARAELMEFGDIQEHTIPTGKPGRQLLHYEITDQGYELLGKLGVKARRLKGRGDWRHRFWQGIMGASLERRYRNARVVIEEDDAGGRADVALYVVGEGGEISRRVAYEVHLTGSYEHVLRRVRADLSVGFDEVKVCVEGRDAAERVWGGLVVQLGEERKRVEVKLLPDFLE